MDKFLFVALFIFKIIVVIVATILLFLFRNKEIQKYYIWAEVGALILVSLLYLIGFPYIAESNISTITKTKLLSDSVGIIKNDSNESGTDIDSLDYYSKVLSTTQYDLNDNKIAYYYDINNEPLGNISLSCKNKSYIKNYGGSISAITTLIGNYYNLDVNEIDILTILEENKIIDCDKGVDFDKAFNGLSKDYYYKILQISSTQINDYLNNGKSVLVETSNKYNEDNNFGCEKNYIVIYNINNDGLYNIINSNDKYESYFCPSNTIGYGSIIEGNQNDRAFTFEEINSKALRYFVIEGV